MMMMMMGKLYGTSGPEYQTNQEVRALTLVAMRHVDWSYREKIGQFVDQYSNLPESIKISSDHIDYDRLFYWLPEEQGGLLYNILMGIRAGEFPEGDALMTYLDTMKRNATLNHRQPAWNFKQLMNPKGAV